MPTTGRFNILHAQAPAPAYPHQCANVQQLHAECLNCSTTLRARPGKGLESVEGGVVITCPACGSRQAVSNQLFVEVTNKA